MTLLNFSVNSQVGNDSLQADLLC